MILSLKIGTRYAIIQPVPKSDVLVGVFELAATCNLVFTSFTPVTY